MDRQRVLADLLRSTADAIDQGTCILTNAQASMIIDELMNRPMSKEQASIYLGMGRSSFDKAVREGVRTARPVWRLMVEALSRRILQYDYLCKR